MLKGKNKELATTARKVLNVCLLGAKSWSKFAGSISCSVFHNGTNVKQYF